MFAFAIEKANIKRGVRKGKVISIKISAFRIKRSTGVEYEYCQKVRTQHLGDHMGAFNILCPIHLIRNPQQRRTDQEEERSSALLQVLIIDASLGVMVTAD